MSLVPVWKVGDLDLTAEPYLVPHGTDYGSPENVTDILRSLLQAGDIEVSTHTGNRTLTLPVLIEGADMVVLAEAEAALAVECDKALNEVYCDPGDGFAAPMVFQVFRGQLVFNRNDEYEVAGYRSYTLTFRALPYSYSATETVTAALAASGSTTTLVDAMSSTTGWTGTAAGAAVTPQTGGGAVAVASTSALTGEVILTATRTGSITTSSTKYLVLDWRVGSGTILVGRPPGLTATGDGVLLYRISSFPSPTVGYTRSVFYVAAASVAVLVFTVSTYAYKTPVVRVLTMDNLDRTDVNPTVGTLKQQMRTIEVGGSAPTIGTIAIESTTSALGDVILYTCPDDGGGFFPPIRSYRVSGASPSSDAGAVSGFSENLDTQSVFDIPVADTPDGDYLVMARAKSASATPSVTWSAASRMAGATTRAPAGTAIAVTLGGSTHKFVRLGMVHLPIMDAATGSTSFTRISIIATNTGTDDIFLDDIYLFNMSTGRLTRASCDTGAIAAGGPSNRLWVDSPSLDNGGLGAYSRGMAADRSDAYSAWATLDTPGVHEFAPPAVKVFTITTNTVDATVSYRHFAAWHTHAGS